MAHPFDLGEHSMGRADFHLQHAARAQAEAERLLAHKALLGARWLDWVAAELYQLSPAPYAAMVRRALELAQNTQSVSTSHKDT